MGIGRKRMRRLRTTEAMRRLVRDISISADDLVYPLFVKAVSGIKSPIKSMDGCFHFSDDTVVEEAAEVMSLGIPAVLLFGLPGQKDQQGSGAWMDDGVVQQAVRAIKKQLPELLIITDVCLCEYTSHGHCGVINSGKVDNDKTCQLLAKTAVSHAHCGADMIAPSDMMDGRVGVIRDALDEAGFVDTAIMAYSAKYASAFYGPFRDAAESAPSFGDRKSYQMDFRSAGQAVAQMNLDIEQGADIIMVKPAVGYLDVISRARQRFDVPVAAYNVSGEYMMINDAAKAGHLDREQAIMETLFSIKRAGADIIVTYFAKEAAEIIRKQ